MRRPAIDWRSRRARLSALIVAFAGAILAGFMTRAQAVPVLVPVYEIEAVSGGHTASLLNLPIGQPGALAAPIPVDIDGDLAPDVKVSVNLVNAEGLLKNPPQPGAFLAPNIRIDRFLTPGLPLGRPLSPLRINVKLTVKDLPGPAPDTIVRFGYDTGIGGSIPGTFDAVLGGLDKFFNPLEAVIDTKSGPQGADTVPIYYSGPLTLVAGVQQGSFKADADLAYKPWPDAVRIVYASDDKGQHISYAHGLTNEVNLKYGTDVQGKFVRYVPGDLPDVDLTARLKVLKGSDTLDLTASVDRLPKAFTTDYLTKSDGSGRIDYKASSDGRPPDGLVLLRTLTGGQILNARVDLEAIPPEVHALWKIPNGGPMSTRFTTVNPDDPNADPKSSPGLGAVEAVVTNFDGAPSTLSPFVANEQQYLNLQSVKRPDGSRERIVSGRVERIRDITYQEVADGFDATADVGDGALPLQVNVDSDEISGGSRLKAASTIAPIPDRIGLSLRRGSTTDLANPFKVTYTAAQTSDVTSHFELRDSSSASAACGFPGTICADVNVRNLPTRLEARLGQGPTNGGRETRLELDAVRAPNASKPNVVADALVGLTDGLADSALAPDDPETVSLHGELLGIPDHVRVRAVEGPEKALQRLDLNTCVVADLDLGTCQAGTDGELTQAGFQLANFLPTKRPADLPLATPLAPNFASVTARGLAATTKTSRLEATGRIERVRQLRYLSIPGLMGFRSEAGGGHDLQANVDIRGVDFAGDAPSAGRVDIIGNALLAPLPTTVDFCLREANNDLALSSPVPFTDACESNDPFGDGSVAKTPLSVAYRAASGFDTSGRFEITKHGDPAAIADDEASLVRFGVKNLPSAITAHVQSPPSGQPGITRALLAAPTASGLNIDLTTEHRLGGADCDDPDPTVDVECLTASITDLPQYLSAYLDPKSKAARAEFHACDWRFNDSTPACRPGTAGQVGSVQVALHSQRGDPRALPFPPVPTKDQYVTFQMDQKSADDVNMKVFGRIEKVRHTTFRQSADGFDASTDLGDGVKPLEANVLMDTRPDAKGALLDASATITPLPAQIAISQHGPGEDQNADPLKITYDSSSAVSVVADAALHKTGSGLRCGSHLTLCAHTEITNLPDKLVARLGASAGPLGPGSKRKTLTDLALDLQRSVSPKPDVLLDATIGTSDGPPFDDTPEIVHAFLKGLPDHSRVRLDGTETIGANAKPVNSSIERLQFHACQRDFAAESCTDTPGKIDSIEAAVRNFYLRPTDFPPPPSSGTPLYATITQRTALLEATAKVTDVTELQYSSSGGLTGVRTKLGDGLSAMGAVIDLKGASLGDQISLGEQKVDAPTIDVRASASLTPLPKDFSFCFREGGIAPLPSPTGLPFTAPCEDSNPFEDANALDHTPFSAAYRAPNTTFTIATNVDSSITGTDHDTNKPIARHRIRGSVFAPNMPNQLTIHVLQPQQTKVATPTGIDIDERGPMRVLMVGDPAAPAGPSITFRGEYLVGDQTICRDPRPNVDAFCVGATLTNLPTKAKFFYDPTLTSNNLLLTTEGSGTTDVTNLELSQVKPARDDDNKVIPNKASVLVVTGSLVGIPKPLTIRGDLDLPTKKDPQKPPAVQILVQDPNKTIGTLNAKVVNFIAPDPTANVIVPARPGAFSGTPNQTIVFIQRGDAFRLEATIKALRGVGYRAVRDGDGKAIGTHEANLRFATNQNVRAFVDLIPEPPRLPNGDPLPASGRTLVDAFVQDLPAGVNLCFRPPREAAEIGKVATTPTWCDDKTNGVANVRDVEGGFQFRGESSDPAVQGMDADAFIRLESGGGTSLLAGRIKLEDIPYVVQGTLPQGVQGALDVAAFNTSGAPQGIKSIFFNLASFDIPTPDTGYTSPLPYKPRPKFAPFLAKGPPSSGIQYAHANLVNDDFNVRGLLGLASGASSHLQHLHLDNKACDAPPNNPPDYPNFPDPIASRSQYSCVKANFVTDPNDPLDLDVYKEQNGEILKLRNAGLTDIPQWFQVTLTKTDPYVADDPATTGSDESISQTWRRPCGTKAADTGTDCAPALIRFDQPDPNSQVFGVLESGKVIDLPMLSSSATNPAGTIADLKALPVADPDVTMSPDDGWDSWDNDGAGGQPPQGVRLKVVTFGSGTDGNSKADKADDRSAVRAAFRFKLPQSLTVDQLQQYENGDIAKGDVGGDLTPVSGQKAKDLRLRIIIANSAGVPVSSIGELTGLVHDVDEQKQIIFSRPCATAIVAVDKLERPSDCAGYKRGIVLPGLLGVQLYTREDVSSPDIDGDVHKRDSKFIQLDGRTNSSLNAGIRLIKIGGGTTDDIGLIEAAVLGTPAGVPAGGDANNPLQPSFRLRAELLKDKNTEHDDLIEFNTKSNIVVNQIYAQFDFSPTATAARQVDAVINMRGARIGADIEGHQALGGTSADAPVTADAAVDIDPFDLHIRSDVSNLFNFIGDAGDIVEKWMSDNLGLAGKIIGKIIGAVLNAVEGILEAFLDLAPIKINLESGLLAQFGFTQTKRFTMRLNALHAIVTKTGGKARVGPINLEMRSFDAGIHFEGPTVHISKWVCWAPGIPCTIHVDIPILTYDYDAIPAPPPIDDLIKNTAIEMRRCDVSLLVPFPLYKNTIEITGDDEDSFLLYPLSDPRYHVHLLGIPAPGVGTIFDIIMRPVFCLAFGVDAGDFQGLNYSSDVNVYNPGNPAVKAFPGHPVPGQPAQPDGPGAAPVVLTPDITAPGCPPSCGPPPPPPPPPPAPPPTPPDPPAPPPQFSGPTTQIDAPISLCGTHEFTALTVNSTVTVATATDTAAPPWGPGQKCPSGQAGKLVLKANNLVVNGTIQGNGIAKTSPPVDPGFFPPGSGFATGSSGGGHRGAGGDGSTPAGGYPYAETEPEPSTLGGAPGSAVDPPGATYPNVSGSIPSAGPAGDGGGSITLIGDDKVVVTGTLSATGDDGASNTAGTCNDTADQNGVYTHTGLFTGSGGGSGGGIAIAATTVDLSGANLISVHGGAAGSGKGGAGGGGGGGLFKVIAPIYEAVPAAKLDTGPGAGADTSIFCAAIPSPTPAATGAPVIYRTPTSEMLGFGTFWKKGDPFATFTGRLLVSAQNAGPPANKGVTVVVCGVSINSNVTTPSDPALGTKFTLPTNDPSPTAPCGSGGATPEELGRKTVLKDQFQPPDANATITLNPNGFTDANSQYLGIYTTAVIPKTAGDNCFVSGADCFFEPLPPFVDANADGVLGNGTDYRVPEQVVGLDRKKPLVAVVSPAANTAFKTTRITLKLTASDPADGSGLQRVECRSYKNGSAVTNTSPAWQSCANGSVSFDLSGGEGLNKIEVRSFDFAQNESAHDSQIVKVATGAPLATATISAADGSAGWHRTSPTIIVGGYSSAASADPDTNPYLWKFDNGSETKCPAAPAPPPIPTCMVPTATIDDLEAGSHIFSFSAVDEVGNRWFDDNDPLTPSPMQRPAATKNDPFDFKLDKDPPEVFISVVSDEPVRSFGGDSWYSTKPFVAVSTLDQIAGSGVATIQYSTNGGTSYSSYTTPFQLGSGVWNVCAKAKDKAGGESPALCKTVHVDDAAPDFTATTAPAAPNGTNGWYVTSPTVSLGGYDDGAGVGADADRFRYRVDNNVFTVCDVGCAITGLTTGEHLVHATATDRFDNRTGEKTLSLKVDVDKPVTNIVVQPGTPTGSNGWYQKLPFVILDAHDQDGGSGLSAVRIRLDGGSLGPYAGPIHLARGAHTVCATAVDVAGNTEAEHCMPVNADIDDPAAAVSAPAVPSSGWYTSTPTVALSATDPLPGSTVNQAFDPNLSDLCGARPPVANPFTPSGICVSVDRSAFVPYPGAMILREGVHTVQTFAIDVSGRRSVMTQRIVRVDLSPPVVSLRALPATPALNGWYRRSPRLVLRAVDGDQNSGVDRIEDRFGAAAFTTYTGPFDAPLGVNTLSFRAFDLAGLTAPAAGSSTIKVDNLPPVVKALSPNPVLWIKLLSGLGFSPSTAQLNWEVTENLSTKVQVIVTIYDEFGDPVRRIDDGIKTVTPGTKLSSFTTWDGRDYGLIGWVGVGVYHYRVTVYDEAGNPAMSGESKPLQIKLG